MTQCIYCEVITLMNLVDIHSEIRVFFPVVRILKIVQHLSDIPYRVLTVRITMLYILIIHIIKTFHCFKMFPKLCKRNHIQLEGPMLQSGNLLLLYQQ